MALVVKNAPVNARDVRNAGSIPGSGKIPWRRAQQFTPVFLPGEFHGQRSLAGCSPWGHKESDTTEATWHACPHLLSASPDSERVLRHSGLHITLAQSDGMHGSLRREPGALGFSPSLSGLGGLFHCLGVHSLPPGTGLGLEDH